jgi:son of sevenless-like protein
VKTRLPQVGEKLDSNTTPWYLLSNYSETEILFEIDGSVKGGTVPALVEKLTAHERAGKKQNLSLVYLGIV